MTAHLAHDVLVIGGGIAGPVAGMALQRAGFDVAVCEAHDRPAEYVGSFLNLAVNGIDALRAIDAHASVLRPAFPTPRMVMWNGTGKRLGEVGNGVPLADGTTAQTIRRGLLHAALRDEAQRRGVSIVGGRRLVAVESQPRGVLARFADGTTASARVLVGADGLHSCVRSIIDPHAPAPRYTGLLSIGGRAFTRSVEPTPDAFHMTFGARGFFGHTVRPTGEVYWFANLAEPRPPDFEAGSTPPADLRTRLRAIFAHDRGPALDILDGTHDELAAYPIFDLPTVPHWHAGPMVIIGDAAHATSPSSGQGASLAIEDAVVLARCLRDCPDLTTAFATYESRRRARVERVVAYARRLDHSKAPGPVGRWIRDLMMPFALRHFAKPEAQAWLFRHHVDWDAVEGGAIHRRHSDTIRPARIC